MRFNKLLSKILYCSLYQLVNLNINYLVYNLLRISRIIQSVSLSLQLDKNRFIETRIQPPTYEDI